MFKRSLLAIVGIVLFQGSVQAHQLKVFAHAEQDRIAGEVYFAGGQKMEDALVSLSALGSDHEIATTGTDADGAFSFPVYVRQGYRISANSGDGHVAHWDVQKSEVILSTPGSQSTQIPPREAPSPVHDQTKEDLRTLIESAVASQVAPLRAELQKIRDERRMQDILGGLGYIAGLAGLAMLWFSRRRGSGQ